jgi:hypothetical protein
VRERLRTCGARAQKGGLVWDRFAFGDEGPSRLEVRQLAQVGPGAVTELVEHAGDGRDLRVAEPGEVCGSPRNEPFLDAAEEDLLAKDRIAIRDETVSHR